MDVNTMLLQGIKVLDLTHAYAGPSCTMLLADLGCDVIKVEPPAGEHYREFLGGAIFMALNRNKRGMVLNLREPEAVEVVLNDISHFNSRRGMPALIALVTNNIFMVACCQFPFRAL